jgi:hypothetical protein
MELQQAEVPKGVDPRVLKLPAGVYCEVPDWNNKPVEPAATVSQAIRAMPNPAQEERHDIRS